MKRGILIVVLLTAIGVIAAIQVWAQEGGEPPAPPATPPAAQPQAPPPPPAATPTDIAKLLDPDFLRALRDAVGPLPRGDSGITGPDKLTVATVPAGCEVYIASVGEIRSAKTPDGGEPAVEDVVFTDAHYIGDGPVTVTMASGDYVVAVRAYGKLNGFDGGCVAKTTTDVITGGIRHSYHLYPLRKREGEYQLFVANFAPSNTEASPAAKLPKGQAIFNLDLGTLAADLAATTNVPEEQRPAIASKLNQQGVAFYELNGAMYLVKLTLLGAAYRIEEWPEE